MSKAIWSSLPLIALIFAAIHFAGDSAVADDSAAAAALADDSTQPSTQPSSDVNPIELGAGALCQAHKDNGIRADATYRDKLVWVTGTVLKVTTGYGGRAVVELNEGGAAEEIECVFPPGKDDALLERIKALNAGDRVAVGGCVVDSLNDYVRIWAFGVYPAAADKK